MKKTMLSAVILLPLIVLMFLFVSTAVIGLTKHIYVESVTFGDQSTIELKMSDENNKPSYQLNAVVLPTAATNPKLIYESEDPSIATVDENGVVTAVDFGETVIYVYSAENRSKYARRDVLVTDTKAHRLQVRDSVDILYVGDNAQLSVNIYPKETLNKNIVWESLNEDILSVAQDGKITGKAAGYATIIARSEEVPGVSTKFYVRVKAHVLGITIDDPSDVIMIEREKKFPDVTLLPAGADEQVTYSSSNNSIATVDEKGNIVFSQAGQVTITATVIDSNGNPLTTSKTYTCTDGYYSEIHFTQNYYEFDYDAISLSESVPVKFEGSPEGANKGVIGVTFAGSNVLKYENGKFYVVGSGRTEVTVTAKTYDGKTIQDTCEVYVKRHVKEFVFTSTNDNSINITRPSFNFFANMTVNPEDYTDTITFESDNPSIAQVSKTGGIVAFSAQGTVNFTITAKDGEITTCEKVFTITYIKVEEGEKQITVDSDWTGSKKLVLSHADEQKAVVIVSQPADYTQVAFEVTKGQDVIDIEKSEKSVKVTPVKGGYATIKITATNPNGGEPWVKTVEVYVDSDAKISFSQDEVVTSKTEYELSVSILPEDALIAKEIRLSITGNAKVEQTDSNVDDAGVTTLKLKVEFPAEGEYSLTVGIYYNFDIDAWANGEEKVGDWKQGKSIKLKSTYGKIEEEALNIYHNDQEVFDNDNFTIEDIGDSLKFTISGDTLPEDFTLSKEDISVRAQGNESAFEEFDIQKVENDYELTLTGKNVTNGKVKVEITVGGRTRTIYVEVQAKAHYIEVFLENTAAPLQAGTTYYTLQQKLNFTVRLTRGDSIPISNPQWMAGASEGYANNTSGTITLSKATHKYVFRSADEAVQIEIWIQLLDQLDGFGLDLTYATAQSGQVSAFDEPMAITNEVGEPYEVSYVFPDAMQDRFSLTFVLSENLLGKFSQEEFEADFVLSMLPSTWSAVYSADTTTIVISPGSDVFAGDLILTYYNASIKFNLIRTDIKRIEFTGFNSASDADVYGTGLQQVRVFAKHSYYNGSEVNYFKVPLVVTGTKTMLYWTLTAYQGSSPTQVLTTQFGRTVTVGDKTYTISEQGTLIAADGSDTRGITWVDPFTEDGYMRIYFGNFNGLSETDIQNDNFGNFDGKGIYNIGSGTFLRVEADDGVGEGGVDARYYNFNVVNDIGSNKLMNIFDAKGFYKYNYVVLQTNLYGQDEQKNIDASLVLNTDDTGELSTNLIYGNGYQVNYRARSLEIIGGNEKRGIQYVGSIYNVTIKGNNIGTNADYVIEFKGDRFYYSEVQTCTKGHSGDAGREYYIKNCVFKYISEAAIQIYNDEKVYLENVVMVDVMTGLETMNKEITTGGFYIKGFLDCFNYRNKNDMSIIDTDNILPDLTGPILSGIKNRIITTLQTTLITDMIKYAGDSGIKVDKGAWDKLDYANIVMLNVRTEGGYNELFHYWDADANGGNGGYVSIKQDGVINSNVTHSYTNESGAMESFQFQRVNSDKLNPITVLGYKIASVGAWSYHQNSRTDINLACQYTSKGEVNADHLAWHMLRAHRNAALAGWKAEDHKIDGSNKI